MEQFWYQADKDKAHEQVFSYVQAVEQDQRDVHEANLAHARLYANREEPGLGSGTRGAYRSGWYGVTENLIRSAVDTAVALIGKSRPRVAVLTDGGDWEMQDLAERLEKYTWGMFQALEIHDKMTMIFRDACIFGTGVLKLFERNGQIEAERVLADEIVVDENEVPAGGNPQQIHQVRLVSKATLKALYPEQAELIDQSGECHRAYTRWRNVDPSMVLVTESWRLAAGKDAPGRHTICVEKATLFDEEYKRDWFPFVCFKWSPPLTGWYGQGIAEQGLGYQIRVNELNDFIQRCHDMTARPIVLAEAGSKFIHNQLTNEIGQLFNYVGQKPTFFTPTALNPETYNYKTDLKRAMFEDLGISAMAAHATRPEGIEAAVALRELSDNQSQRHSNQQQRFESAHMLVGRMIMETAREMHPGAPKAYMAGSFVESIDWPEVDFDKHKFVLQIQPASMMTETPAARKQFVLELQQYNVPIPPAALLRLLNLPDLEAYNKRATSSLDDIEWVITRMKKHGEYWAPEPFQDLALGIEHVTAAYLDCRRGGLEEAKLDLFRRWITQAQRKMKELQAEAQAEAMAAQVPPQPEGAPMPPDPGMQPPPDMPVQ